MQTNCKALKHFEALKQQMETIELNIKSSQTANTYLYIKSKISQNADAI